MAQNHTADFTEKPMTVYGRTQGPSRRYRRLRHPTFPASEWTTKNPLLQRGEIGVESDTHKIKVGDGTTYWNSLPYAMEVETEWGNITGDISDQTDLQNALDDKVDKTSTANQVYGTDNDGEPTTYNLSDLGGVTDVKVNNVSVVTNKVADIDLTSYLQNTATATDALTLLGTANTSWVDGINIGKDSRINSNNGVAIGVDASADVNAVGIGRDTDAGVRGTAIGAYAKTSYDTGIAIGCWNSVVHNAVSSAKGAYQFGVGTNNTARTLNVGWYNDSVSPSIFVNYQLLDGDTGLIPDARISTNITRTADLATVATTGSYNDLLNKPTLGTAAAADATDFATAAQGAKADTALQPGDDVSDLNNDAGYQTAGDVATAISGKQDTLTAGTNITITGTTISATDTTYSNFTGATAGDAGTSGLVPAPAAGDQTKFLQGDGTWATVNTLPSQTGNAGKFLTTDGTDASWSDKPLVNTNPGTTTSLLIGNSGGTVSYIAQNAISITSMGSYGGWISLGTRAIAIGTKSSTGTQSINIGGTACEGNYAIQLGQGSNNDANTFKVGNHNGNFEIMSANGTIPEARLADTTSAAQGQVLTLDSNLDATWATFTPSVAWGDIGGTITDQTDMLNISNWSSNVTNCITEIPQDVIAEFDVTTKTLTIKAGSKLYIPNGFEADGTTPHFDTITFATDQTLTNSFGNAYTNILVCWDSANNMFRQSPTHDSGSTDHNTTLSNRFWYDTDTNKIKYYAAANTTVTSDSVSLPVCKMECIGSGNGFKKILNVFNGFGYIGCSTFVLPGVKALAPNGRNADGTYKNTEITFSSVILHNIPYASNSRLCFLDSTWLFSYGVYNYYESDTLPEISGTYATWYDTLHNLMFDTADGGATWTQIPRVYMGALYKVANNVITNINIKDEFKAVDYSDKHAITDLLMPDYTAGVQVQNAAATSGSYTAPSNGQFVLDILAGTNATTFKINNIAVAQQKASTGGAYNATYNVFVKYGDSITWSCGGSATMKAYFYPMTRI